MLEQGASGPKKQAILAFNFLPAAYTDASWYDASAEIQPRLAQLQSPAARRILSDWLLVRYGLDTCTDFDFIRPEKTMCLLEPARLRRLAIVLGMLRHRESLRRMIGGGTLRRLGEEVGNATVRRAFAGWPAPEFLPGPEDSLDRSAEQLAPQLTVSGARWLFGLFDTAGRAIGARARFKFPRALAGEEPVAIDDATRETAVKYLKDYVLKDDALCQ